MGCDPSLNALRNWAKVKSKKEQIKLIEWEDTVASSCRWSEYAEELIKDWAILWEDSEADYQGSACVLAYKNNAFRYIEWYYGSCSGCDSYEDLSEAEVREEFKKCLMDFKNVDTFCNWIKMLYETNGDRADDICNAINSSFKNTDIKWIDEPEKFISKINTFILLK
jgi:hypothetical protein